MNPNVSEASRQAWTKFLHEVAAIRERLECAPGSDNDEPWFRGHSRGDYDLLPSLFRSFEDRDNDAVWEKIWRKESDLFWEVLGSGPGTSWRVGG